MEYKGIRFSIRTGIVRDRWSVAIHPAGGEVPDKVVVGARPKAESMAHSMIDAWLRAQASRASKHQQFD
jgi:hypothetical protein